jgi:hypothetical protein
MTNNNSWKAPQTPERHPDNPLPSGPFTHWIDTNVMLEIYSHGDLYKEFDEWGRGMWSAAKVEDRRMRMQGSLWLAMALCQARAITLTYQHENLRNLRRLAPPGSFAGSWTSAILYFLGDGGVFDGWERHLTNDAETLTNKQRDSYMVNECRTEGLVLITRDDGARDEARAAGVDAAEPEAFAARFLACDDARRMFDQKLGDAAIRYLVAGPPQEQNLRIRVGRTTREVYGAIWQPLDEPVFV